MDTVDHWLCAVSDVGMQGRVGLSNLHGGEKSGGLYGRKIFPPEGEVQLAQEPMKRLCNVLKYSLEQQWHRSTL